MVASRVDGWIERFVARLPVDNLGARRNAAKLLRDLMSGGGNGFFESFFFLLDDGDFSEVKKALVDFGGDRKCACLGCSNRRRGPRTVPCVFPGDEPWCECEVLTSKLREERLEFEEPVRPDGVGVIGPCSCPDVRVVRCLPVLRCIGRTLVTVSIAGWRAMR